MIAREFDSETTTTTGELTGVRTDGFAIQNGEAPPSELHQDDTFGARIVRAAEPDRRFHLLLSVASPVWMYPPSLVAGGETTGSWLLSTPDFEDQTWRIQNARRGELLLKRLRGQLSPPEAAELRRLQSLAEQRVETIAARAMSALAVLPSPPAGMDRIVEPPAE